MRVKTVIKRVVIGIVIFFVAMFAFGIILQITGYEPPAKPESAQKAITEMSRQQPAEQIESQGQPQAEPAQEVEVPPVLEETRQTDEPQPALLEPIDPARTDIDPDEIKHEIKYAVASVEPGHIGVIKRYAYRVIVYQRLSKAQLMLIADTIYKNAQKENPFNALKIVFYDYPKLIPDSARLGYVDYAPNGKWEDAGTVKTGQYAKMKIIDHLFEPDWSKAVTEREVNIYADYMVLERQYSEIIEGEIENGTNTSGYNPMERALPDIARRYNMSEDEVFRLIMKVSQSYEKTP
jgi:hypothetical protein